MPSPRDESPVGILVAVVALILGLIACAIGAGAGLCAVDAGRQVQELRQRVDQCRCIPRPVPYPYGPRPGSIGEVGDDAPKE